MTTENTNAAWQIRKNAAIARGEGNLAALYVDHAKGSEMWDVEGNRYIDFATGIAGRKCRKNCARSHRSARRHSV